MMKMAFSKADTKEDNLNNICQDLLQYPLLFCKHKTIQSMYRVL